MLETEVRKPADAEAYRQVTLANAEREAAIAARRGRGPARPSWRGDWRRPKATEATGAAEAKAIEAKALAEAAGIKARAAAWPRTRTP